MKLAQLEALSDPQMVNELATHMTRATAPAPSVETILHALLPHKYVDHTHADAVLAVTNTADGDKRIAEIYGDKVVVIPYVMPGFDLARLCAEQFPTAGRQNTIGMVLMKHGIFSFGATARESYERMIELVDHAERLSRAAQAPGSSSAPPSAVGEHAAASQIAALRRGDLARRGHSADRRRPRRMRGRWRSRAAPTSRRVSQQGPATPDHVIRTKRVPMVGRDVEGYRARVPRTISTATRRRPRNPRPCSTRRRASSLDPELGHVRRRRTAQGCGDRRRPLLRTRWTSSSAPACSAATAALPQRDIFDVEYWDLEQAKLRKAGKPPVFTGEVALVTGAASGIGKACVDALLARGAAVVGLDVNRAHHGAARRADFLGMRCDVTSQQEVVGRARSDGACLRRPRHAGAQRRRFFPAARRSPRSATKRGAR